MQSENRNIPLGEKSICLTNSVSLAPMAGVTDATMRRLCVNFGADFTVSEMVSAKAITMGDQKSRILLRGRAGQMPYGVQLFGYEPQVMGQAVEEIAGEDFDFIDLNMGCPAPKIVGQGAGSALLKNPLLAQQMVEAAVKASQSRPVSVKMRIGWDSQTLTGVEVAKRVEQAGAAFLAVHARTREEMYTPGVHWDEVAKIRQAVTIPVLYNGDVDSPEAALQALAATGCDGVMIGRASAGQPWIFAQVKAALTGQPIPPVPSLRQRLQLLDEQVQGMCREKGEGTAMRQARGMAGAYMRGLREAAALRNQAHGLTYYSDLADLVEQALQSNPITETGER